MRNDRTEEHVAGSGGFVAGHHGADHVGAGHGNDGELLVAKGFFLGSDFGLAVLKLFFPALEIGLDPASLPFAEVVEFEEWSVLLAVVENRLDHVACRFGHNPGFFGLEGEVPDFEGILRGEKAEREGPEKCDKFHGLDLSEGLGMCHCYFESANRVAAILGNHWTAS